jgi:hypothetical protein
MFSILVGTERKRRERERRKARRRTLMRRVFTRNAIGTILRITTQKALETQEIRAMYIKTIKATIIGQPRVYFSPSQE